MKQIHYCYGPEQELSQMGNYLLWRKFFLTNTFLWLGFSLTRYKVSECQGNLEHQVL